MTDKKIIEKEAESKNCTTTSKTKVYYRVDTRCFSCGEKISTTGEYYNNFPCISKYVDDILEKERPENKKKRRDCLFLFEDKKRAEYYCVKVPKGKLYEVSISADQILHRGDTNLMDCMKDTLENHETILSYEQDYNEYKNKMSCCIAKSDAEKKTNIAKKMSEIAKKYWLGGERNNPKIEILVDSAVITKFLSNGNKERECYNKKNYPKRDNLTHQNNLNKISTKTPMIRPQTTISAFLKKTKVDDESKAMVNSINASLERNLTYLPDVSPFDNRRKEFRKTFTKEILKYSETYHEPVSCENHIENIKKMCDYISKEHGNILINSRLNFGTVQKAFNLYLKFLWCLEKHKVVPPHCPVDSIILRRAKVTGAWTKLDCEVTYKEWIDSIKKAANEYDSMQHWELHVWNEENRKRNLAK